MPRHALHSVLIVEDEPKISGALKDFFETKGFRVSIASTVEAALAQFGRMATDVVLVDVRLPDGSGLDLLTQLKQQAPEVRAIVMSGVSDPDTIHTAQQRGAASFLAKPFDFGRCFYAAMGIETVELETVDVDPAATACVPAPLAQQYRILPLGLRDGALSVATTDPLDVQRLDELAMVLGHRIRPLVIVGGTLEEAWARWYGIGASLPFGEAARTATPTAPAQDAAADLTATTGVTWFVNDLIRQAHLHRATDLHLGLGPQGPWMRERIDGILYDIPLARSFSAFCATIFSRFKIMANLDIAERRLPQDGRAMVDIGGTTLDIRLSFLPTPHGESLAIRLLEPSLVHRLDQLGLHQAQYDAILSLLVKPAGFFLVTGPTGSGKSTSLYAFLTHLNTGRLNIVTLEDPIEHELASVTQMQVQPKAGPTFATGLRSILRHDPDVIMVGEIRDHETAQLAVRAALTGHLVLATLHTMDAASGLIRLLDLGIDPCLLRSTAIGLLSQRLVRQLCVSCRRPVESAASYAADVTLPPQPEALQISTASGCPSCRHTGYHGRTGVFELLVVNDQLRSLITGHTSAGQLRQAAVAHGMCTLSGAGWMKVHAGITSLEEIVRVLPPELR